MATQRSEPATTDRVLITGASSGIGLHLAHRFAAHGHPVCLVAPDATELDAVAADIRKAHGVEVMPVAADLEKKEAFAELDTVTRLAGWSIDILVNNAGHGFRGRYAEVPLSTHLSVLRLNVEAAMRATSCFLPRMVKNRRGRVLNTASIAGFEPGPGMGGHCLPVDPFYLTWRAREFDFATEFIELAGKVNQDMPRHCVHQIERALNDASKSVRGAKVLVLGVSYKKGVGDIRESPALKIIDLLHERGAQVVYHDEFVPELPACGLVNTPSLDDALEGVDLSVVVTAHPNVDFAEVVRRSPATVDFRGVTRHLKGAAVPSA